MTTSEAIDHLKKAIDIGCEFVDFNGGEPTIRKDIEFLIKSAKDLGFKAIAVTTNGRLLSYENIARKLIDAGLNSVVFSIHGHTPELHDYLTQVKGSYFQTIAGLKNFKKLCHDGYICSNTVIIKQNYKFLPRIAEHNIKLGVDGCEFIFVHPRGRAYDNFDSIVPTLTEISSIVPETLDIGKLHGIIHFHMRYLPLCFMHGYLDQSSELQALKSLEEQHVGPEFQDLNVEKGRKEVGRVKGPQCIECKLNQSCEGVFKEYAERRGFHELKIIK
jgi:molybdenum cofactor biosynthesis enzyme MoaA